MKTRRNARENSSLILTTVTFLTLFLATSVYESSSVHFVVDCDTDVSLNPDQICVKDINRIATCKDRCGNRYNFPCTCDSQCVIYNNCCENMTYDCPEILKEGKQLYGNLIGASIICTEDNFFMIDSCQQSPRTNSFDEKGQTTEEQEMNDQGIFQLLANVPVTSTEDGITYINSDAYLCYNNASASLVSWDVSFVVLDALGPLTDLKSLENSISLDSVMYIPPERVMDLPRQCQNAAVSYCKNPEMAQRQPELETQCESFIAYVETVKESNMSVYTNRFCLECSESEGVDFTPYAPLDQNHRVDMFHFNVLISLQAENKVTLKANRPDIGLPGVITWKTASCDLTKSLQISNTQQKESTGSSQDGPCDIGTCETGYKKHSDGQCKKLHVLEIGLADDEFPLTTTDREKLPFFIECALRKRVNTEVARVLVPARVVFDKTLNKTLYLLNIAVYEPRYDIMYEIFTIHKTWTLQLAYIVKAFHEYRRTRALIPAAENMVKISETPSIETYDLLSVYQVDFTDRGPRINNITTTICLRAPNDVLGCWEDPFFANEEKLISDLAQCSCFSHLQGSNHGVSNRASGQTLTNQCSWKFWLLMGVGLVTALIL